MTATEGRTLLHCHGGCATPDVLAALNLTMADLFDEPRGATYRYDNGRTVHRTPDKKFRQANTDKPPELYRLAKVRAAITAGRPVFVVEGESDVHALEAAGVTATCNPMGAGKWSKIDPSPLYGGNILVIADQDEPGRAHAAKVYASLVEHADVGVFDPKAGKDAADHIAAGHRIADFIPVYVGKPIAVGDAFTTEVEGELHRLRVRDEATRRMRADHLTTLPEPTRLDALLTEPDDDPHWRIDGWWPTGGKAMLSAQFKAGKSTLSGNTIRALVDGTPFLDRHPVRQAGRVVLIDNELDRRTVRRWLREQGINNQDRVDVFTLRGRAAAFNILDPATRARWAKLIGPADVLVLDCLRPAMDALRLSEDKDGGVFLAALDALLLEARIGEVLVIHHMGHNGERERGDSRFKDWPDAAWTLVRDNGDDTPRASARRYLRALGRDVDQAETLLDYDPTTRRLSIGGGSRHDVKVEGALDDVLGWLEEQDTEQSGRAIEGGLRAGEHSQRAIRSAVKRGIEQGLILTSEGERNAVLHFVNPSSAAVRRSASPVRQRASEECVSASLREDALTRRTDPLPVRHPTHSDTDPAAAPPDLDHCPTCGVATPRSRAGHASQCNPCSIAEVEAHDAKESP